MQLFKSLGPVFGGTVLIASTTIGVGMLALPIETGPAGFVPSISVYILCWLFMLCTGLLLLEVCRWMPKDSNLISMARKFLGPFGQAVCWVVYLFLFVTVMIAHVAGGGEVLKDIVGGNLPVWVFSIIYVVLFSPIVYLGTSSVEHLNTFLFAGVVVTYLLFIGFSYDKVNMVLLKRSDWTEAFLALPVLFTAFTYQVIIPTLMSFMNKDVKKVRLTIILGTTIPLVVYLIWELLILSIIPVETLIEAKTLGQSAVQPLKNITGNSMLFNIGKAFAFFTLTASYIALALAFLDFLADGLKVKKTGFKKICLCLLVFIPPTLIAVTYPNLFLTALSYAGGYSCAILFGLFPPLMVWIGRYKQNYDHYPHQLFGGKWMLSLLILFILFELMIQLLHGTLQLF